MQIHFPFPFSVRTQATVDCATFDYRFHNGLHIRLLNMILIILFFHFITARTCTVYFYFS